MNHLSSNVSDVTRIELTPELVFERISDVGSPPSSTLSFNSRGRSYSGGNPIPRPRTSTPPSSNSIASTLPRRKLISSDIASSELSNKMDSRNDMANRRNRGYYSLGSGITKAAKQNKPPPNVDISDYGVAISIKGIKGLPFVILEDKENHRHMVPAPDPSEGSDLSSGTDRLQNGSTQIDGPPPQASPRKSGTLNKDWKERQNTPDVIKSSMAKTLNAPPNRHSLNGPSLAPQSEKLVKPSEIKASQKPSSSPSALHMRSPRSRTAHERSRTLPGRKSDAVVRSRSLSPNRALASIKPNRSRSVSPPRKNRTTRRVDDNSTQPVSSLIGFFEVGPEESTPSSNSSLSGKAPLSQNRSIDRGFPKANSPSVKSPRNYTLPKSSERRSRSPGPVHRPRNDCKEIEVTMDSRKPNLTVTTATVAPRAGTAPPGRYFAITSPVATSPKKSSNLRETPRYAPKLASVKAKDSYFSSSSEGGRSTEENTPNLNRSVPFGIAGRSVERDGKSIERDETRRPERIKTSGVSAEALVKPSSGSSMFGPTERKDVTKQPIKRNWQTIANRAVVREEEILPKQVKRDLHTKADPFKDLREAFENHPAQEDRIIPKEAKKERYLFTSLQDKKRSSPALKDLVDQVTAVAKQEKTGPKQKNASAFASVLVLDKESPVRKDTKKDSNKSNRSGVVQEELVKPRKAKANRTGYRSKDPTSSPMQDTGLSTVVSKAKVIGPSQELLRKTRRKRNARKISTSNPGSRAVSGSEWSESEYSDAESLGMTMHTTDDEHEKEHYFDESTSLPEISSPVSTAGSDTRSHKKIVFGKIASQDVTKVPPPRLDQMDGPVEAQNLQSSAAPTVSELQEHISDLRATVQQLQQTTDDNLQNYELLSELQNKLQDVEKEKNMLEEEIVDGRKTLKNLEKKLDFAQDQISELRRNERSERRIKEQQNQELEDLKSQLMEMNDELEGAKSASAELATKSQDDSHLLEDINHLRNEYDEILLNQRERERLLLKREEELLSAKKLLRDEAVGHDEEVDMMRKMHEDVLSRLRDELDTLRQESVSAVEARPRLEEQVASLKSELNRLKNQRSQEKSWRSRSSGSSSDEDFTSSAASRAREEAAKNKKLLLDAQEELRVSQATTQDLRNEIRSLRNKLSGSSIRDNYEEERLQQVVSSLDQAKVEKKSLESNLSSLELQRTTLRGQIVEARNEREDGERQIRGLETEISRLKGRILELENEVERLKKELVRSRRHLEAQVVDLEHQTSDSDRKLSELTAAKANLEKELSEAKLRRMSSSTAADATNETLKQLEEYKRKSMSEVDSLRQDAEAKARALREAERNNNKLQEELRRMDLELEEELKERETTMAEFSQAERTIHELEVKISEAKREKEDTEREIEKLQGMLSLTEDDKLNLEEKLDASEKERMDIVKNLHLMKEDVKDKDMELEELKFKVKNVQSEVDSERSKVSDLEHHKYVTEMQVSGLKEALEAKYEELGEVEGKLKNKIEEVKESEEKNEETLKKLRDTEKQRRLAAKEAEDLTIALSEKVAMLDEAQRKLRRLESQLSDMDEASSLATSFRLELDKAKRSHAQELARAWEEAEEAKVALASSERNVSDLENEVRTYEERYEASAIESLELEKLRRNLAHQAEEAKTAARAKEKALSKAEEKIAKLEEELANTESKVDQLSNQLREAERRRKEAELHCHDAESELADKERELKNAEKRIHRLRDDMEKSNEVDEETKQVILDLEESKREAQEDVSQARGELKKLQLLLHKEEEKVEALEDRLIESNTALRKELEDSQEADDEKERLLEEIDALKRELFERNRSLDNAQVAIQNIEQKMKLYESSHDQSSDRLQKLESDKKAAQQKVDDLEKKIRENQMEMENSERSLYDSHREAEVTQNRCQDLEEELLQNNQEITALQNLVEDLKTEVARKAQDKLKAEKQCDSIGKQVELLQLELKERGDWSNRKEAELQQEVRSLEAELKTSEEELTKVEKEKRDIEKKLFDLESKEVEQQKESDSALRKEIQQLRDTLDEKTQQVYAAEDTIYRQKEVIEELTAIQQTTEKSSLEQMDAYMAESDKQFEQLKSHLQEKNDSIKSLEHEKEGLERETHALSEELERAQGDVERIRSTYEKGEQRLEELEHLLKELRAKLTQEQKDKSDLLEQVAANLRNQSRNPDSNDDEEKSRLYDMVEDLTSRLQQTEEEKEESLTKLRVLEDKVGQLYNELEMEKSQAEVLQNDKNRQKQEIERLKGKSTKRERSSSTSSSEDEDLVSSLKSEIASLEEKLEQEANELSAINTHHQRTEMKLREVLKQAETETNKANGEKEMMSVRMTSLKQQLLDAENQLSVVEEDRRQLQDELSEQTEVNYELKQSLAALRQGSKAPSSNGSLYTSV